MRQNPIKGGEVKNEDGYQYVTIYEFEDYGKVDAFLNSGFLAQGVRECNASFGEGGRHHVRAVEIKCVIAGKRNKAESIISLLGLQVLLKQ